MDAAQRFRPGFEAGDVVDADAQDLGIQSRETGCFSLVRRDLVRSYGGPGQREEGQDDIFSLQAR
jgi:hypothetical protein